MRQAVVRDRLGEVADRPHEGGGGRGVAHQGGARALLQGAAADDQGDEAGRAARARPTRRSTSTPRCGRGCRAPNTRGARRSPRSASAAATSTRCWKSTARRRRDVDWDGSVEIVALGGRHAAGSLAAKLATGADRVDTPSRASPKSRARRSTCRRSAGSSSRRIARSPICRSSSRARRRSSRPNRTATAWHTPEGAHFGAARAGQARRCCSPVRGRRSVGMLRDLACLFPEMLDSLAVANAPSRHCRRTRPTRATLGPHLSADDASTPSEGSTRTPTSARRETRSRRSARSASARGASWPSGSASRPMPSPGTATANSSRSRRPGGSSPADLFTLSRLRGRLMGEQRAGDPGAMLAVLAPLADIERVIADRTLDLVVANQNAPKQTVLSGSTPEIEPAAEAFAAAGVTCARLPVAAAFHSRFVADAAVPFRAALESVEFAPACVPVFANTTAAEYPDEPAAARDLLGQSTRQAGRVRRADPRDGRRRGANVPRSRSWVGPDPAGRGHSCRRPNTRTARRSALDASGGKRSGVLDLANVLARLAARGHRVNLPRGRPGAGAGPRPLAAESPG